MCDVQGIFLLFFQCFFEGICFHCDKLCVVYHFFFNCMFCHKTIMILVVWWLCARDGVCMCEGMCKMQITYFFFGFCFLSYDFQMESGDCD